MNLLILRGWWKMVKAKDIFERMRGAITARPITISKKIDVYLSEHLPDLIDEYKLATKKDLEGVDKRFELYGSDIATLEDWKVDTQKRVVDVERRVERIEVRRGVAR